jgi:hypothetical protein
LDYVSRESANFNFATFSTLKSAPQIKVACIEQPARSIAPVLT